MIHGPCNVKLETVLLHNVISSLLYLIRVHTVYAVLRPTAQANNGNRITVTLWTDQSLIAVR